MLVKYPPQTLVIVDEIQKLPELLDVDHKLMVENGLYFILSGSSARKIKKAGVNQLGGRANEENLYPLVFAEILNYDNVASDCGVSVNTSKFYFFDVGILNYLLHRYHLMPGTPEYGHAFESIVMQEIRAYLGYTGSEEGLTASS